MVGAGTDCRRASQGSNSRFVPSLIQHAAEAKGQRSDVRLVQHGEMRARNLLRQHGAGSAACGRALRHLCVGLERPRLEGADHLLRGGLLRGRLLQPCLGGPEQRHAALHRRPARTVAAEQSAVPAGRLVDVLERGQRRRAQRLLDRGIALGRVHLRHLLQQVRVLRAVREGLREQRQAVDQPGGRKGAPNVGDDGREAPGVDQGDHGHLRPLGLRELGDLQADGRPEGVSCKVVRAGGLNLADLLEEELRQL
mmetsp:Transcript_72283/g.192019  ORF Transcript_72283/g.192019 Transcript_72283/m.192019 type:complete len:253 (+) Transcript_72283:195-953(+)